MYMYDTIQVAHLENALGVLVHLGIHLGTDLQHQHKMLVMLLKSATEDSSVRVFWQLSSDTAQSATLLNQNAS